jgi:hypothetical protein
VVIQRVDEFQYSRMAFFICFYESHYKNNCNGKFRNFKRGTVTII